MDRITITGDDPIPIASSQTAHCRSQHDALDRAAQPGAPLAEGNLALEESFASDRKTAISSHTKDSNAFAFSPPLPNIQETISSSAIGRSLITAPSSSLPYHMYRYRESVRTSGIAISALGELGQGVVRYSATSS